MRNRSAITQYRDSRESKRDYSENKLFTFSNVVTRDHKIHFPEQLDELKVRLEIGIPFLDPGYFIAAGLVITPRGISRIESVLETYEGLLPKRESMGVFGVSKEVGMLVVLTNSFQIAYEKGRRLETAFKKIGIIPEGVYAGLPSGLTKKLTQMYFVW